MSENPTKKLRTLFGSQTGMADVVKTATSAGFVASEQEMLISPNIKAT